VGSGSILKLESVGMCKLKIVLNWTAALFGLVAAALWWQSTRVRVPPQTEIPEHGFSEAQIIVDGADFFAMAFYRQSGTGGLRRRRVVLRSVRPSPSCCRERGRESAQDRQARPVAVASKTGIVASIQSTGAHLNI
jgi:hypothetical protein